jgi:hypothetical protein
MATRRDALSLGGALVAAAVIPVAVAAAGGTRTFALLRGSKQIGSKTLTVSRAGSATEVAIDIAIKVRILGIPAYDYRLSSRETWVDGRLQSLSAETSDNGEAAFARASRNGGTLAVEGSGYTGTVEGNPATTTYWSQAFLSRNVWISTQSGQPLSVSVSNRGAATFPVGGADVAATRWSVSGDIGALDLFYDESGEWIGSTFEARGQQARFAVADLGPALAPLWSGG